MAMKVEILSKRLIKPSLPTPPSLRHYKISFLDELSPSMNVSMILLFPPTPTRIYTNNIPKLEKSLEQTLTRFYPLAGRYIRDLRTVDCNDEGAEFVQARVNIKLHDILDPKVKPEMFNDFIPREFTSTDEITDPILVVQVTVFECGGLAISVSVSHRIADASTISTFLNAWAAFTRGDYNNEFTNPFFDAPNYFPGRGFPGVDLGVPRSRKDQINKYVSKRFSFSEKAISNMRDKAKLMMSDDMCPQSWSKVQLVAAVMWKAFMGVDWAIHGDEYPRSSILFQPVNIREKTSPPIPKTCFGNLAGLIPTECTAMKTLMEFEYFASLLSDSVKKTVDEYSKIRPDDGNQLQMMVINPISQLTSKIDDTESSFCVSSWCKFPFYKTDFGWGKPIWITIGSVPTKNCVGLLDNGEGNGVDAYVHMEEQDMPYFEQDQDIIRFTTISN